MIDLLIVYKNKDEDIFQHIKGLIEEDDDNDDAIVGTKDGTIKVYKCEESKWEKHKKAGRENLISDKVLFIDVINPKDFIVIDYDKYGIKYGRIKDNNYALHVDDFYKWQDGEYESFIKEFDDIFEESKDEDEGTTDETSEQADTRKKKKRTGLIIAAGVLFPPSLLAVGGVKLSKKIKNDNDIRKQQLMFGITKLYYEKLSSFVEES